MKAVVYVGLVVCIGSALAFATLATIGTGRAGGLAVPLNLPSRALTPGWLNPEVTQANLSATVCVSGYSSTIRPPTSYTGFLKREELRYRKLPGTVSDYQLDHFVSLSLGGSAFDTRNLWLESEAQALANDRLEAQWHRELCAGSLTLKQAQSAERQWKRIHG